MGEKKKCRDVRTRPITAPATACGSLRLAWGKRLTEVRCLWKEFSHKWNTQVEHPEMEKMWTKTIAKTLVLLWATIWPDENGFKTHPLHSLFPFPLPLPARGTSPKCYEQEGWRKYGFAASSTPNKSQPTGTWSHLWHLCVGRGCVNHEPLYSLP